MDFNQRLQNYAKQNSRPQAHRSVRGPEGLTSGQRRRLFKKDRAEWAGAQASETTRDHR